MIEFIHLVLIQTDPYNYNSNDCASKPFVDNYRAKVLLINHNTLANVKLFQILKTHCLYMHKFSSF